MKILIDNGHGTNTAGKHSPDYSLREYAWAREMAQMIVDALKSLGYDAERIVTEETDIAISTRYKRVNAWCDKLGTKNVCLVSIHNNAAGNGGWYNARGWLSIIDDAASANTKTLANLLFDEVAAAGIKTRQYTASQKWYLYSQTLGKSGVRLGILRSTKCPAVLTENLFQDNKEDVAYLLSDEGKRAICNAHVNAIVKYVKAVS